MKYEAFLMSEQLKSIHIFNYLNLEEVSLTNLFSLQNIIKYIYDYLTFECRKKVVSIYLTHCYVCSTEKTILQKYSSNSGADASKLLENREQMFPC